MKNEQLPQSIEPQINNIDIGNVNKFDEIIKTENRNNKKWLAAGIATLTFGLGSIAASYAGIDRSGVSYSVPYSPSAQNSLDSVDNILADIGEGLVPLATLVVGGTMLLSRSKKGKAESINKWSSTELTDTGKKVTKTREALKYVAAGSIPVLASLGAGLATFSSGIGSAITNGPTQPIEALSRLAPGNAWIVQDAGAMPMVQSNLSSGLVLRIENISTANDVKATPINFNLGTYAYKNNEFSNLSIGTQQKQGSLLYWNKNSGCNNIPISIDPTSGIRIGSKIQLDGISATVVEDSPNISAINRVGIVMDSTAMSVCIDKSPLDMYAVILDTNVAEAKSILKHANTESEAATVISKQQFINNSIEFWRDNVKPITNVLSLVSLGFAAVAMSGAAGARLYRNKRQWAQKLADGMSMNTLRATELLRAAKEGLIASVIGVTAATSITPMVGIFASAFRPDAGLKEWFVGGAVGILGPVGGTLVKLLRANKIISKEEDTRGA